jgi:hypothetical protein
VSPRGAGAPPLLARESAEAPSLPAPAREEGGAVPDAPEAPEASEAPRAHEAHEAHETESVAGGADHAAAEAPLGQPEQRYAFHEPLAGRTLAASAPAVRYANLAPWQCRKELAARKLSVKRWDGPAKGIATPVRFSGPLEGVRFVAPGGKSPYGLLDCRLALALTDFARALAGFGVVEVRVDNMYRPRAHLPGRRKSSQHSYGLGIDITSLKFGDGRTLVVEDHWRAPIGAAVCGPAARLEQATAEAILLHDIVCDVARKGIFHHMLTPSYNAAHRNHFHFDIKRDANYRSVR